MFLYNDKARHTNKELPRDVAVHVLKGAKSPNQENKASRRLWKRLLLYCLVDIGSDDGHKGWSLDSADFDMWQHFLY